jgi:hypothetical protein
MTFGAVSVAAMPRMWSEVSHIMLRAFSSASVTGVAPHAPPKMSFSTASAAGLPSRQSPWDMSGVNASAN